MFEQTNIYRNRAESWPSFACRESYSLAKKSVVREGRFHFPPCHLRHLSPSGFLVPLISEVWLSREANSEGKKRRLNAAINEKTRANAVSRIHGSPYERCKNVKWRAPIPITANAKESLNRAHYDQTGRSFVLKGTLVLRCCTVSSCNAFDLLSEF